MQMNDAFFIASLLSFGFQLVYARLHFFKMSNIMLWSLSTIFWLYILAFEHCFCALKITIIESIIVFVCCYIQHFHIYSKKLAILICLCK